MTKKLKIFKERVNTLKGIKIGNFEVLETAARDYWRKFNERDFASARRDHFRSESRQRAALFGESLGSPRWPDSIKAQLRMAPLVSDAWKALAVLGPKALKSLSSALKERAFMHWAKTRYQRGKNTYDIDGLHDVLLAFDRADSWREVITQEEVEEWQAMNALWDEMWNNFNV